MSTASSNGVTVSADIGGVIARVSGMPHAIHGALRWHIYDLLSHHRSSVIAHHKLPSKRRAQQMIASRLYRYTKPDADPSRPAGVVGEAFAAAQTRATYGGETFKQWEEGADIHASGYMIIPIGPGLQMVRGTAGAAKRFRELIKGRQLMLVPRIGKPWLLAKVSKAGRGGVGLRTTIYAMLFPRRRQPAMLGYYAAWARVQADDLPKFERLFDEAQRGLDKVVAKYDRKATEARAYQGEYRRVFEENLDKPIGKRRGLAAAAAKAARDAARASAVGGGS